MSWRAPFHGANAWRFKRWKKQSLVHSCNNELMSADRCDARKKRKMEFVDRDDSKIDHERRFDAVCAAVRTIDWTNIPVREQGFSAAILKQYAATIKKPMDVQTLAGRKQQLVEDIGSLPRQQYNWLMEDMLLIAENAIKFNNPRFAVYKEAVVLEMFIRSQC